MGLEKNRGHIVLIIPALNEEKTIEKVLKGARQYVDEIIVVDDGSKDKTAAIASRYASVIKHARNKGYDASIDDGFKLAKKKNATAVLTMDADGQHAHEDIPRVLSPIIEEGYDLVVGERPYCSRISERVFRWFGRKWGIKDPLCGMKAYRIKLYEAQGFFDNINSIGTQLAFFGVLKGFRVKNVKIGIKKRKDTPRFGRSIRANYKILTALIRLNKYLKEIGGKKK